MCWAAIYSIKSPLASITASFSVHGGDYLGDGGHQAVLDAIGMLIGMSFKFAAVK